MRGGERFCYDSRSIANILPMMFLFNIYLFFLYFVWQLLLLVFLAIGDAILETVFKVNENKRPIELGRLNLFAHRHTRPTDLIELK